MYYNIPMKTIISAVFLSLLFNSGAAALDAVSFDKGDLPALARGMDAAAKTGSVPLPRREQGPGLCIFNGLSGSALGGEAAFNGVAAAADAVYAGESHDQLKDHLAQLKALQALAAARGEKIAVGFEMLNMTLQPVLDAYSAGQLTEEEFLLKADWKKEWGFDFKLYKPLFDFIRANKLKALALNLPKKVVSKIARVGLAGLGPEEKQYLPARVEVTTDARYIAYIRQAFEGHGKGLGQGAFSAQYLAFLRRYILGEAKGMGDFTFENYLAAMSAWNEAMGARLADFLNANPGYAGLVVAGSGHVIYNAGIPASVAARTAGLRAVSFYPADAAACPAALPSADAGLADYVWYIDHAAAK